MLHLREKIQVELQVFCAFVAVALLNIFLVVNLSQGQEYIQAVRTGIETQLIVYAAYAVLSLLCILKNKKQWLSLLFFALLSFMTIHILTNLYELIVNPYISDNGKAILTDALCIWSASNVVFGMWYWMIDRGGPISRALESDETRYDLLFPQYQTKIPGWHHWHPSFLDYLFFSFFTSTGFSPADTLPLTKRVKLLMMLEAFVSLIIIGMVVSRAISLIQ